jgi:symplekin
LIDEPTLEIVSIIKHVVEERHLDVRFLIPILGSLDRSDVLKYLPRLMKLPKPAFEKVVQKLVTTQHGASPPMDPTDLIFVIHLVDPSTEQIGLSKIKDATQVCLSMKEVFKQEILAAAIQRLADHTPLPLLLMRLLIQTVTMYPALINFLNHAVTRLIAKKIWMLPHLWEGFIKYCQVVKFHALAIILQLPKPQALDLLRKAPDLRLELERFFSTHPTHQLNDKFHALLHKSVHERRSVNVAFV